MNISKPQVQDACRGPVPPFPVPRSPVPGFKDSQFQSISRFSTEKTIFLPVFNLQTLKTSLLLVFYSYSTRMYSYSTRMYSYVLVFYSYVTRMLLVCTRMLLVCTRMYSYVLVCTCVLLVCYSYVLVWCFSHDLCAQSCIKACQNCFKKIVTKTPHEYIRVTYE
jgi:hypothetical protein